MKKNYFFLFIVSLLSVSVFTEGQVIWTGSQVSFFKAANADWTLPANQDVLTSKIVFTRQSNAQMYNYQWWQDKFSADATQNDLKADFWNRIGDHVFTPSGGIQGVRWAILDNIGATSNWTGFSLYGTLGDSTHFYSFHNVVSLITVLESGVIPTKVNNDFNINSDSVSNTEMRLLVGKTLGVRLVDENIYLTLKFTDWGSNGGSFGYDRSTDSSTTIKNLDQNTTSIYSAGENIYVNDESVQSVSIYDLTGVLLMKSIVIFTGVKAFKLPAKNLCIVRVITTNGVESKVLQ